MLLLAYFGAKLSAGNDKVFPSVMPFVVFDEQNMNLNVVNFINFCSIIRFF